MKNINLRLLTGFLCTLISSASFASFINCHDDLHKTDVKVANKGDDLEILLLKGIVLTDPQTRTGVTAPYMFLNAQKGKILKLAKSSNCVSGRVCYSGLNERNLNVVFEGQKMYLWATEIMDSEKGHSSDVREFNCR
ncbi:MAG TPA: hypothetical protein VN132_01390 [Bdellovibrio sp.]|nr:hypothetical protein [Bdellovibrio sp.]